jgi:hypothetical protein
MRRFPFLFLLGATAAWGQVSAPLKAPSPTLSGSVESGIYTSPTGAFKIDVPVLPALGGTVADTGNVVTFHDDYGLQITVGAFPQDATLRWEMSTRGVKDYLIYFFANYVLSDFKRFCPGTHIETAGFSADLLEGALFTYILLPGGSMFADRALTQSGDAPVAKRGNLLFVRNGYTFVISTELSERVTEGSRYTKTPEEEDQILRARMVGLVKKIQFLKPAPAK